MSDLQDDELEFSGGTLQLSTDHPVTATPENTNAAGPRRTPTNVHPSVLSGADSLTSSSSSFAGKYLYLLIFVNGGVSGVPTYCKYIQVDGYLIMR